MKLTGPKVKADLIKGIIILIICLFSVIIGFTYIGYKEEHRRIEKGVNILTGMGYNKTEIIKGKAVCPKGEYGRWYHAVNKDGKEERGVLCVTGDTGLPYTIPAPKDK
ncbi:hypothetical protein OBP_177 [Pseudomonas phage OBP]|uniref:hypothetical protein n=1 Tax=Pseudomonas phage OBP TaxID=1124849 RepID=UPI000240D591|nr:hypothetical protein OBP_177 [Pseudomonas phage OBP]AEV89614.1 hypothetical protein OBP_177 [Pseudomonas phage OBP]